jgi:hypothetical protein
VIRDRQEQLHERILQWRSKLEAARERLGSHRHPDHEERARAVDDALASIAAHASGRFLHRAPAEAAQLLGWFESTRFLPERGRSLGDADAAWQALAGSAPALVAAARAAA